MRSSGGWDGTGRDGHCGCPTDSDSVRLTQSVVALHSFTMDTLTVVNVIAALLQMFIGLLFLVILCFRVRTPAV